jgi:dTDP-4-amino-4,6-dideoxygalactose transaminase
MTSTVKVPFLDLKAQYESICDEITAAMQQVLDSTSFAGGPFVAEFEKNFAAFCGTNHAVGVGSGTEAIWLALLAIGIGPGDEVITTPNTFIATAEAVTFAGAKPVFVDIDEETYNMSPQLIERAITMRTGAVIPVHLYGHPADMDPIMEIADAHGLAVIEDACQAHGAQYKSRPAGSIGRAGCFSFYPGKNLGAYGEAGAVVTNDAELSQKIRMLRDHGQSTKYYHSMIGWNARMDGLQAAVLNVKLKYLTKWNEARRRHAGLYNELLAGVEGVVTPAEADYARHIYHIYAIRTNNRDGLIRELAQRGIMCGIHYPVPLHLQDAYKSLGFRKGSFPIAERIAQEVLSLPMFAELEAKQIETVAGEIRSCLKPGTVCAS